MLKVRTWGRAECRSDGMCGMQYWYVLADGGKLSGVCIAEYCDWGQDGMHILPDWPGSKSRRHQLRCMCWGDVFCWWCLSGLLAAERCYQ